MKFPFKHLGELAATPNHSQQNQLDKTFVITSIARKAHYHGNSVMLDIAGGNIFKIYQQGNVYKIISKSRKEMIYIVEFQIDLNFNKYKKRFMSKGYSVLFCNVILIIEYMDISCRNLTSVVQL